MYRSHLNTQQQSGWLKVQVAQHLHSCVALILELCTDWADSLHGGSLMYCTLLYAACIAGLRCTITHGFRS